MSTIPGGLPPISDASLPADIRNGSPDRKKAYEAALSFESVLVQQLTKSLADTAQPPGDSSSDDSTGDSTSSDAATSTYQSMLPDTLANGIMSAGGLGIARTLMPPQTGTGS